MFDFRLSDLSPKDKPWDIHRQQVDLVAALYAYGGYEGLTSRMDRCSGFLEFRVTDSQWKLTAARFCRVRHCPVCQWRKSLMWKARAYKAFPLIEEAYPKHRWLFLTLTIKNCQVNDLRTTIKLLNESYHRLVKLKQYPGVEYIRSLEVTRDKALADFAHPHIHALILVKPSYFKSKAYVRHDLWVDMWRSCLKVNYSPSVRVSAVKNLADATKETLKYAVKPEHLYADADWLIAVTKQLHGTRSIAVSKGLSNYFSDAEPTDEELIHGDESAVVIKDTDPRFLAEWDKGRKAYRGNYRD